MEKTKYKNKRKLLLIYNDDYERSLVSLLIDEEIYKVYQTSNPYDGINMSCNYCPDVILISSRFSEKVCCELVDSVRKWSKCSIIMICENRLRYDISNLLDEGMDDCINIPSTQNFFNAKINANLRRSMTQGESKPYKSNDLMVDYERRQVLKDGKEIHLSPVEYRIVECLSSNAGKVVSYKVLLNAIWGPYMEDDSKILRVNMANIRKKLQADATCAGYIHTVARVGYRMDENDMA